MSEDCTITSYGLVDDTILDWWRLAREEEWDENLPALDPISLRAIHLNVATRMQAAAGETRLDWEVEQAVRDHIELLRFDRHRKETTNEAGHA